MKQSVDQYLRKAASLSANGRIAEAELIYRNVLERFPANKRALDGIRALTAPKDPKAYARGVEAVLVAYEQGRLAEALDKVRLLIDLYPSEPDLHNLAGAIFAGTGQFEPAIAAYDRAIGLNPGYAEAHANRASALINLGRHGDALESCDAAIRIAPGNAQAHSNRGIALRQVGRLTEAVSAYDAALRLLPDVPEIHYNRANLLDDLMRHDEAVQGYDRAIALQPSYIVAHSNRGNALQKLGRLEEAVDSYGRAIALNPQFADAHSNLGNALLGLGRLDEAHASSSKAVELQPGVAELHYNLAVVLEKMLRLDEAIVACDRAIACDPNHARAYGNRGHALFKLGRSPEAAESYAKAVTLDPGNQDHLYALANILQELGLLAEAVDCYRRVTALNPDHDGAIAQLAYQRARMCEWDSPDKADLGALAVSQAVSPLIFTWLVDSPQLQHARATRYASEKFPAIGTAPPRKAQRAGPIRIGYFSAEFHDHAVMFQLARLFELHDRSRFSIHAYSFGPNQPSPMRQRLIEAFDVFHDVSGLNSREIAGLARADGIDVAIDLMGYTGHARPEIFSMRPAPVQVQYMGYPGTMGAPFVDYLVADDMLIPEGARAHYAEKIIYLPNSYQANDDRRQIAGRMPSRTELGLPSTGFVFCSFNNSHKITPAEFDIWMRLLTKVDGSVLWLFEANARVEDNLRREAAVRGVDPTRLIFAGRMPHAEHLARLRQADLFLDCFQCNAHATAADALWAGVPVLTVPGQGYAARVGASVVHAVGLPELAVATREDYQRLALELATDPARLVEIRDRLAHNRTTMPLFDSARFTRHIETAFEMAYDRFWNGMEPDHIRVPGLPVQ
ncbi:hypothetical protein ASE00_01030 [Sphingomonas sp. Root710]|uniref:O-linked N-acetylglucosamine transferase family protein n=1 Tax=Sphingomonas sp. Root710 TaxID=1736594 RepID=UPI0006F233BF|nr:tetratricopeptide repeat protein [Sphingomonas sp. Root710]KRB85414.1 hypothetical protein ASE00_01030 [Sphingomonas sp. Root710]